MSLVMLLLFGVGGGDSVIQSAPSSGLRCGKHGISSEEIGVDEASMSLNMSLSGIFRLDWLMIISSFPRKDCWNEALKSRVPTILPHDGSKHVDGNTAGSLEVESWRDIMVTPLVQLLESDDQMCRISRL